MKQEPFINYTKEAFALPINLIFLSVMLAATVVCYFLGDFFNISANLSLVVAFLTAAAECFYLALAPQNQQFIQAVNAKNQKSIRGIDRQLGTLRHLQAIKDDYFDRYTAIFQKKLLIKENLAKNNSLSTYMTEELSEKVENLESCFVEQLYGVQQYETIQSAQEMAKLESEKRKIETEMNDANRRVQEFQKRRLDIIRKRMQSFENAKDNIQIAKIQLDTIEDVVNLMLEQSLTLKNPDEIARLIDTAVAESEANHDYIRELDAIMNPQPSSPYIEVPADTEGLGLPPDALKIR